MTNAKSLEKDDPDGNDLKKEIAKHEHLTNTLCAHVNEQCADALFVLASLYYDQALDRYIKAREEYAKSMDDKGIPPRNKEAVNPIPDYTESMEIYAKLIREYSDFKDIDEAYYQVGTIYLLKGDIDSSRWAFKKVLDKAPESRRASAAHFRLADFSIMEHDYPGAFKHLESCKKEGLTQNNLEMVQYRKGEICFNLGEFEKAVEYFFGYIEKCDIGEYRKCEFRQEALEFMAVAFSDMPKGAEAAIVFFNIMGGRSYEDYILYTIGLKNKAHGQTKEAIAAFQKALKKYCNTMRKGRTIED